MNAKPFTQVRYLRSIAPLPIGIAYTRTLMHVFHLTRGTHIRGTRMKNACMRSAASNRRTPRILVRSMSQVGMSQTEADKEEPEGEGRSRFCRSSGSRYADHPIKMVCCPSSMLSVQIKKFA
ncbi:MAG TPA: hypothetical protein V6C84_21775 [Coleofasciculaceae cyanobacterium]|jgi:hypothetical protein